LNIIEIDTIKYLTQDKLLETNELGAFIKTILEYN